MGWGFAYKLDSMTNDLPTLIISRKARHAASDWDNARSWLGGKPQLGKQPWPRGGKERTPFYFLAQIDLAAVTRELAQHGSRLALPDGALAFFVGRGEDECAVVHVSQAEPGEPTELPSDAPAVLNPGGDIFPATFNDDSPRLFPRWPVDITALDLELQLDPDADEETRNEAVIRAQVPAVERRFTQRQYFFTAKEVFQMFGDVGRELRWHSGQHYAACLRTALRARPAAEFEGFVRDVSEWVRGRDSWESMTPDAVEVFTARFGEGRRDFLDFTRFYTPRTVVDLQTETLLALATANDRAYETLPEEIRTLINTRYLLPSGGWHQMFGHGVDIQGNAAVENEGNVMLLQLVYDDMIHWRFGDMGAYQFWISPPDLAVGNWANVGVTFECH